MGNIIKKYFEMVEDGNWTTSTTADHKPKQDKVVEKLRSELLIRSVKGISKYGKTLNENTLTLKEWLQHAKEEALDFALYLQRAIDEIDGFKPKQNSNK